MKNYATKSFQLSIFFNFFRWSFGKPVIPDRICFNKTNMRDVYRAGESSSNPSFRIPINFPAQSFQAVLSKG